MRVRQHDGEHRPIGEVREVGQHQVDLEVLVAREREPASTTIRSSPSSKTVMFFPTSPRPPSGMMRSGVPIGLSLRSPRDDQAATGASSPEPLEALADFGRLGLVGLDEREAQPAHLVAEQLKRLLDRDRVRLHLQDLDRGPELLVEGPRSVDVARR